MVFIQKVFELVELEIFFQCQEIVQEASRLGSSDCFSHVRIARQLCEAVM